MNDHDDWAAIRFTPPGGAAQTRRVPYLGPGASTTETFTYAIPCDTASGTVLTNTATATAKATGGGAEANTANHTAKAETAVHAPKLTLAKTAPRTVNAGEAMTIDLKVVNAGSGTATEVPPTRDPWPQLSWQLHPDRQSAELLARIQATDSRFDGADGSAPDGALSRAEVNAVFGRSIRQPDLLRAQLLTTYLNLADRRINAATKIPSLVAAALELTSVAHAARHAQATLLLPDDLAHLLTYTKATTVLTEINLNLSERY